MADRKRTGMNPRQGRSGMHGRAVHEIPSFLRRLDRQAAETRHLRQPVYTEAGLERARTIVDVGCGTGSVTAELAAWGADVLALDVDAGMARRAAGAGHRAVRADGHRLPLADASVDAAVCNLVLLWARDPGALVAEMARVVRPGGVVVASMEPDYSGKVHWPRNPLVDVVFQGQGVRLRGGDPEAGRKLRQHFVQAGLVTSIGISNAVVPTPEQDLANLRRHRGHYRRLLRENGFGDHEIDAWEEEYMQALEAGVEMCFLPLFYAIGRKAGGDLRV